MSADLVAFIEARLAEDESAAAAATPGPWAVCALDGRSVLDAADELVVPSIGARREWPSGPDAAHIARHDPARVLRELPLIRRLLDEHRPRPIVDPDGKERDDWPERVCRMCDPRWMGTPEWAKGEDFVPPEPEHCEYLRTLGSIWSDHSDFRAEWRPVG